VAFEKDLILLRQFVKVKVKIPVGFSQSCCPHMNFLFSRKTHFKGTANEEKEEF
jgi:hypothetical protein